MNYCINYNKQTFNKKCIENADELSIIFNEEDNTLKDFLDKYKHKRINIEVKSKEKYEKNIFLLQEILNNYDNVYIKLDFFIEKIELSRFFFNILVKDWDTLIGLLKYKISDIYIVEEMGFELEKISKIIHDLDINIRVYPNIAQSSWNNTDDLLKFFIRPEDIDIYSQYVDTIEFYNVDDKIDMYYKIYNIDKQWFGQLKEIILDFKDEIDNKYIIPRFAEKRLKCNKKCLKGSSCRRCFIIKRLSSTLEDKKIVINIKDKESLK